MEKKIIINQNRTPTNQAEFSAKSIGMSLIKQKFYNIDYAKAERATEVEEDSLLISGTLSGVPVFDSVVLKRPNGVGNETQTFVENNSNKKGVIDKTNDLILPIALLTVNQERNIVRTNVQGRNGSVKEFVSDGDYSVTIEGVLVNELPNKSPIEDLKKLHSFCKADTSLDVISNILDAFGILSLVINDYRVEQREGMRNVIDFTLYCYSDTPFEIKSNA